MSENSIHSQGANNIPSYHAHKLYCAQPRNQNFPRSIATLYIAYKYIANLET